MRKKRSLLNRLFLGVGATALTLILVVISFGIWPSPRDLNSVLPYSPFKSEEAKEAYLKVYDKRAEKWPVKSKTKMVNTSYGQTFVRISGPDGAIPLVLMHGINSNSLQWMSNVESLSTRYKVFAIDNVFDNGRSIPAKIMSNADDYVNWLNELFDALALDEGINIVGLSYGGWITAQYALKFPNRLHKIVLLAPAGTVKNLSPAWIFRAVLVAIPLRYFTENFAYWLAEDTVKSGAEGRALIDEHINESIMAARSFKARKMVNPTVLTDEELQSLNVPILFMVGENEKIYPPREVINRLNTVAPQIQTKIIMNAGHDLTMAQAQVVNSMILEFLSNP